MSIDLKDAKYRHDLKGAVRTLQLFLDYLKDMDLEEQDSSFSEILGQVVLAQGFLENHVSDLYSN